MKSSYASEKLKNQIWPDYIAPVSYTHLDVYKRQRIRCLITGENSIRETVM